MRRISAYGSSEFRYKACYRINFIFLRNSNPAFNPVTFHNPHSPRSRLDDVM